MNEKPTLLPAAHRPHAGVGCASPGPGGRMDRTPLHRAPSGEWGVAPPPPTQQERRRRRTTCFVSLWEIRGQDTYFLKCWRDGH